MFGKESGRFSSSDRVLSKQLLVNDSLHHFSRAIDKGSVVGGKVGGAMGK